MSERSRARRAARQRKDRARRQLVGLRDEASWRYEIGDLEGAISSARKALDLTPRDEVSLRIIYQAALELGDHDPIAEHAGALLRMNDDPGGPFFLNVGIVLSNRERYEEAQRAVERYLSSRRRKDPTQKKDARNLLAYVKQQRALTRSSLPKSASAPRTARPSRSPPKDTSAAEAGKAKADPSSVATAPAQADDPPRVRVRVRVERPDLPPFLDDAPDPDAFGLRVLLERARLADGYDELLCLRTARGVDHYWYQVETARRAMKRFGGRVLLADEVGLGKTIEAAMIAAEYRLRGLARRVLVLAPPSLVTQWREELSAKFGLEFADAASARGDPDFWRSTELVVASIALARAAKHRDAVAAPEWDIVIVDEAHRLKNRNTRGWELVNRLHPKFLLMLSATPVQNDLVELYNVVTLLRPGTLGTEAQFRRRFIGPDGVKDVGALRDLLASVMIRNTRGLIDAKLPNRYAETFVVEPGPEERAPLVRAEAAAREIASRERGGRMAATNLLLQAGSSPAALGAALERVGEPGATETASLGAGAKGSQLVEILRARPGEKAIVFVQFVRTLEALAELLRAAGIPFAAFTGSMSGAEKERAVAAFRDEAQVLLSTGSGGEGRNLQFARTVVNFDLPWNPMQIEQRIGRVHRLGQQRDVFVFNMALSGSIEDRLLNVLDRKINMFEMVVGEIDDVLGDFEGEFSQIVFNMWLDAGDEAALERGFDDLAGRIIKSRDKLREAKVLDERLFGEDFGA
ncbi:MAG: DEAD/DEAH box helicase [Planctomycetota bacterium]